MIDPIVVKKIIKRVHVFIWLFLLLKGYLKYSKP